MRSNSGMITRRLFPLTGVVCMLFGFGITPCSGAEQAPTTTQGTNVNNSDQKSFLAEPFLSIIGGGLAAALVTILFNVYWDRRKEKRAEEWEFRRYRANLVRGAAFGLMDAFFSAKTEIDYLVSTLETLLGALQQLDAQADTIVRQQGGPQLTVPMLEQRKAELMQPFHTYNQQQVGLRWNQYEQKVKDLEAKAESYLNVLKPLLPDDLNADIAALFDSLTADYVWDLPHAKERLELFKKSQQPFQAIQRRLATELEKQLGREDHA